MDHEKKIKTTLFCLKRMIRKKKKKKKKKKKPKCK